MFNSIDEAKGEVIRSVGRLCAAAAVTAPKSGGQLFLRGKPLFIETALVDDHKTLLRLADWMRRRGRERRQAIWLRDAALAGTRRSTIAAHAVLRPAPSSLKRRDSVAPTARFSSSRGRNAICATSTWGSRSVRPPRRPAFMASIRVVRLGLPSPRASLGSFSRRSRSHCQ